MGKTMIRLIKKNNLTRNNHENNAETFIHIGCNKSPATHYFFDEIFIFNSNNLKLKYYIVLELNHLLYKSVLVLVVLRGKICEIKIRNQLPLKLEFGLRLGVIGFEI